MSPGKTPGAKEAQGRPCRSSLSLSTLQVGLPWLDKKMQEMDNLHEDALDKVQREDSSPFPGSVNAERLTRSGGGRFYASPSG